VCRPLRRPILAMLPLLAAIRLAVLVTPLATKFLVDEILLKHRADLLWVFLAVSMAVATIHAASLYGLTRVVAGAHQRLLAEMRSRLQAHLVALPLRFHDATKTGALVSSVMIDTEGFSKLLNAGIVESGGALLGAAISVVVLMQIDAQLASGALVLIAVHAVLSQRLGRHVLQRFREHQETKAEVVGRLTEALAGIRVVKAYQAERSESDVIRAGMWRMCLQFMSATRISDGLEALSIAATGIGTAVLITIGASRVFSGDLTVGGLLAFSVTLSLLMAPLTQVVGAASRLPQALAGVRRTIELLAVPQESAGAERRVHIPRIRGQVTFDRVTFAYLPGRSVLRDVSFEIEAGSVTAFVGASGAGKSTIASLIASLYAPSTGRILVDGVDLTTVTFESYRTQIGMVLQDTFLFDGTVLDNVAFSRPHATRARIVAACRAARVDEFVEQLPEGYDSPIGERGVRLSGGQRQRIAIARALLADPRILILDEPTSNLDHTSERLVVEALRTLMADRTSVVISHRTSLIRAADRLFHVQGGGIVRARTDVARFAIDPDDLEPWPRAAAEVTGRPSPPGPRSAAPERAPEPWETRSTPPRSPVEG
jgi:ABC-type bacteriocin/lantibiotic exporter with double-glycine peptidase domain